MKKIFISFLCVIMVMVFMPTMVFAAEEPMSEEDFRDALQTGEVDLKGATVTLNDVISLADSREYTVKNGTIAMSESYENTDPNNKVIAVQGNGTILNLENVTVIAASANRGAIYVGNGGKLTATDLTVDNSKSDKGAIIINKDANAYFNGKLDLKLGSNS